MAKGTYIRRFDEKRLHPTADAMRPLIFYSWTSFERAHTFSHMQIQQQQKTNHRCFQTRGLQIALKSEWCALDEPTMATQAMTQSQQNDAYRTMMDWWHGASCAQSYHLYMATLKVVALNIKQKRNDKPNFNSTHDHRSMSSPRMFTTHSVEVRWCEVRWGVCVWCRQQWNKRSNWYYNVASGEWNFGWQPKSAYIYFMLNRQMTRHCCTILTGDIGDRW